MILPSHGHQQSCGIRILPYTSAEPADMAPWALSLKVLEIGCCKYSWHFGRTATWLHIKISSNFWVPSLWMPNTSRKVGEIMWNPNPLWFNKPSLRSGLPTFKWPPSHHVPPVFRSPLWPVGWSIAVGSPAVLQMSIRLSQRAVRWSAAASGRPEMWRRAKMKGHCVQNPRASLPGYDQSMYGLYIHVNRWYYRYSSLALWTVQIITGPSLDELNQHLAPCDCTWIHVKEVNVLHLRQHLINQSSHRAI